MQQDLVSIITPAYNAQKTLVATIESVRTQTYQNWEMIISNDCSTDGTKEIAEQYAAVDKRIHVINAEANGGVAKARNIALEKAQGKYIAFLDSDDLWESIKLENQIEFMKINGIAFSFTSYQLIDENGNKLDKFVYSKSKMRYQEVLRNTLIYCLTVVVDRDKVGSFKMPPLSHTEDQLTWVDILKRGYVAYGMPEVLALYRVSSNSLTSSKVKSAKLQWETYRKYCKFGLLKSSLYFISYAIHAVTKLKTNRSNE